MPYINLNGKLTSTASAWIPIDNGSFRYGYGLFETMLVQEGIIRLKEYHWERLFAGMKQLYFDAPSLMTTQWLEDQVIATVKKNKQEQLCRVRLQLFATGGGMYSQESRHPGLLIECFPLMPDAITLNENGLVLGMATGISKSTDSLANLKSCNALVYAIAARQAKENKWNDALVTNTAGNIIESAIANVFWIKDGIVYTPPLTDGCVAGVMRRHLLTKISVTEKSLDTDALLNANEVFLTNAIKNIRWVKAVGDREYKNDQIRSIFSNL